MVILSTAVVGTVRQTTNLYELIAYVNMRRMHIYNAFYIVPTPPAF